MQLFDSSMHADEMPTFPALILLASSYTPFQPWEQPMDEAAALEAGTVFPSLVKPFMMAYGCNAGCTEGNAQQEKGGAFYGNEEFPHAAFGFHGKI